MSQLRYLVDVYAAGSTSSIAFSLKTSQLLGVPTIGGQLVRAGEGIVESQPCQVTVLDINSTFTHQISSTKSGRLNLLGRLCRIRSSLDSTGTYTTLFTGRVTDLQLRPDVVSWNLTVADERVIERNTYVFSKANTVSLMPRGLIAPFQQVPQAPQAAMKWLPQIGPSAVAGNAKLSTGNFLTLWWSGEGASHPAPAVPFDPQIGSFPPGAPLPQRGYVAGSPRTDQDVANFIIGDVRTSAFQVVGVTGLHSLTQGNFRTVRWRKFGSSNSGEVDFEIYCFGFGQTADPVLLDPTIIWKKTQDPSQVVSVSIIWSTAVHGALPARGSTILGYVYAPTHLPTATVPLHIGGQFGQHPFQIVKDIYQGKYNATGSTTLVPRISTGAFDTLTKDPSYGKCWLRVTDRALMADVLNSRFFVPYNVVPLLDAQGRVAPKSLRLPSATQLPTAPAVITSTNALTPPTWENPSREAVNAIAMSYDIYGFKLNGDGWLEFGSAADGMTNAVITTTRLGDNVTNLGVHRISAQLGSVSGGGIPYPIEPPTSAAGYLYGPTYPEVLSSVLAKHKFARFQDGPLYSQVDLHRSIDATTNGVLQPGAFVKMRMGTWPNPFTRTRTTSSSRWMQVIQRQDMPTGPRLRMLDAGPVVAAYSTISITLILSTVGSTRHTIVVGTSAISSGSWEILLAHTTSTGASVPASSSLRWTPIAVGTSATLKRTIGALPAHTLVYAKVRALYPGKGISAFSTAKKVATATIPGTTSLVSTGITAGTATIKWSKSAAAGLYGADILLDKSTVAANLGTSRRVGMVGAGTTRYVLGPLSSGSKHIVGVRYRDPYGGKSTMKTVVISTTGKSRTVCPTPTIIANPKLI